MTNEEHLDRIEDFIITYACHAPALESLTALRASIAETERQREKYRNDALKLNEIRAALTAERDQATR